eukprot:600322-Pyramimonas_sp.AAC.1
MGGAALLRNGKLGTHPAAWYSHSASRSRRCPTANNDARCTAIPCSKRAPRQNDRSNRAGLSRGRVLQWKGQLAGTREGGTWD